MEPDPLGTLLGTVIGALGALADPQTATSINHEAPATFRPLRFAAVGQVIDIHPTEIESLRFENDPYGLPRLAIRFGPDVAAWVAATTQMAVGDRMLVSLCEQELMDAIIQEPILSASMALSGSLETEEMTAAMLIVAGQVDCEGAPLEGAAPPPPNRRSGGRP